MTDFPNLDISIGEYYKLLLEGRRPMRNRHPTTDAPRAPPLTTQNQSNQPRLQRGDVRQSKEPRSSEKSAQDQRLGKSQRNQSQNQLGERKRIDKDKHKLKHKRNKEEHKTRRQHINSQNTISVMKQSIMRVQDDGGGIGSDVLKLQQQTQSMLKERKKQKSINEAEQVMDIDEQQNDNEKLKDEKKIVEKFENVDPHPLYCTGRYVINKNDKDRIMKISKVSNESLIFTFDKEEEKSQNQSDQKLEFISKVFIGKLALLEDIPDKLQEILNKGANNIESYITIAQKLTLNRQENQVDFVTFIPSSKGIYQAIDINLKENINYQKELKEFEDISENQLKFAYHKDHLNGILDFSKNIQDSFTQYFERAKSIQVTKENMQSLLYSVVSYEQIQNDTKGYHRQKQGIFLRIKYDPHFQDHMIFLRLLNHKNTQKERTDWFQLSKFSIKADLTRGFVSLDYIKTLENINSTSQKLKLRMFQMVSYQESKIQRLSLRNITDVKDHSEAPRQADILKDSSHDRCSCCNYITHEIEHLKCSNCQKNYHYQCLKIPLVHSLLGIRELEWRCQECIRCTNCLSVKNREQMLVCQICNAGYHYDCLDQSVKLGVPSISQEKDIKAGFESKKSTFVQLNQFYKCEQCVECEHCGTNEAGEKRINKWSKDYKLCSTCNKKRQNKQYCLVCEKFWPENEIDQQSLTIAQEENKFIKQSTIQCGQCDMQVHLECDRIFLIPNVKQKFYEGALKYNCQSCRQQIRLQLISQIIDKLSNEDRMYFFQEPVEDHVQNYTKIIKNPMCFKYIRQRIASYLRNPEQLKSDIGLIFSNAITFNLPKHKVHKEAQKIKEICNNILSKVWNKIEKSKLRTLDEDTHQQRIKDQMLCEKLGQSFKAQPDEMVFMLQIQDLLDNSEHQPSQNQLYSNSPASNNHASVPINNSIVKDDQEMDGSDYNDNIGKNLREQIKNEGDEEESDDHNVSQSIGDSLSIMGYRDGIQISGITKNLRVRKQINYNEDRLLASGNGVLIGQATQELTLSGHKRAHQIAFKVTQNVDVEDQDSPFTVGGNSIKSLKRQRQNQIKFDPDFVPPNYQPLRPQITTASLLQQAIHQESRLHQESELMNMEKHEHKQEVTQINHIQQQQQMMMNYYQEIDDEKCYYSNPARCSFDDPSLLFEEMCYLCGSFGNREDFLSCTLCAESFHTYCLQLPEDKVQKFQSYWKCLNCKFCEICASATQEAFLLYCDVCDKAFHSFCLKPQLKSIPNCQWKCQECFKCQQCGTKEFFSVKDTEEKKNLDVTDFEFSQNFAFCYQCGKNEYKKSFCKICQKKTDDSDSETKQEGSKKRSSIHHQSLSLPLKIAKLSKVVSNRDQMMRCNQCGFYSHFRCSRLLPPIAQQQKDDLDFETDPQILKEYKCLECLLAGKTINHLIRETCEQYENIHQIISRQKLLAQLCQEILSKYFPIQEKAPLFIKSFIDQNSDFFRKDEQINEWLALLETNVCFEQQEQEIVEDDQEGKQIDQDMDSQNQVDAEMSELEEVKSKNLDEQQLSQTKNKKVSSSIVEVNEDIKNDSQNKLNEETKPKQEVQYKKWNDINLNQALEKFDKTKHNQQLTSTQKIYKEMYGHKETFLPEKRNLYYSLSKGDLHRFGQRKLFIEPQELKKLITVPNDEKLSKVNFSELYVTIEFKAIMKIKLHFFRWFEDLIKSILKNNQKFLRKEKRKQEIMTKQLEEASEDVVLTSIQNQNEQALELLKNQSSNNHISEDDMCLIEDIVLQSPQMKLQCVLCKQFGELTVTGRLIPFQVNQFVHVNCALWSTDVYEIGDGQLVNFFFVQSGKSRQTKCQVCGEMGATIICFTRKCHAAFHFPCAYRDNRVAFLRTKETYCDQCSRQRDLKIGYLSEFSTKRRFQIARNQIPWNMSIMFQSQSGLGQSNNPFAANTQLLALQQTQMNLNNISNPADLEKPLQIEKWRPFYFDMFNRVGNLTVLSLKKEINHIIDDTINGSKKEQNMDNLPDFAAIRIYWKFYKDYMMSEQEEQSVDPINMKKSYFMYNNNTIREVIKNDLQSLLPYSSEKIKEKILFGIHHQQAKNIQMIIDNESTMFPINQTVFWQKIMQHFQRERPNFTLQNIIFSISEFGGKTKYPISVWNRAEVKNKSFFLKSGTQVLSLQNQSSDRENLASQPAAKRSEGKTIDDVFKRMIKINQMGENQNTMNSMKRLTCSKHMKYESMLHTLGKKMFYTKSHQDEQNHNQKTALAKKIRLTDTIDTNKEIDLPIAMKYRLSKAQPKRVEVGPSKIHRNGLFTLEDLMPGDIVIEYVGEKIRNKVADKREVYYEQKGIGDCYLFRLDKEYIIDATFFGNKARYLNHSCDANCSAKIINVQQQKHIIISTNRQIKSGEELTYNYNFDYEADKIECFCGAPTCSGRLN